MVSLNWSTLFLLLTLNTVWASENRTLCQDDAMNSVKQSCQLNNAAIKNLQLKLDAMEKEINQKLEELKAVLVSNPAESPRNIKRRNIKSSTDSSVNFEFISQANNSKNEHAVTKMSSNPAPKDNIPPYYPPDCKEALKTSYRGNGVYKIQLPDSRLEPFDVYCETSPNGTAYTVIQRRVDASVSFERPWADYVRGFGDLEGNFWIGLEKLYELTRWTVNELLIVMEDFNKKTAYASYSNFMIGGEKKSFVLKTLGKYKGTAGDSLWLHRGSKFSTYDRDNDNYRLNCAELEKGAWWYYSCYISNLNGRYLGANVEGDGIVWTTWRRFYSLKNVKMMIKRENIL